MIRSWWWSCQWWLWWSWFATRLWRLIMRKYARRWWHPIKVVKRSFKNEFQDDVDQSFSEDIVNLAKTREGCSVLVSSVCLTNQLILGEYDIRWWWCMSTIQWKQHMISNKRSKTWNYHSESINQDHWRVLQLTSQVPDCLQRRMKLFAGENAASWSRVK